MEIRRRGTGRVVTLAVAGKMDAYWSDMISRELEICVSGGARDITLDLSAISFISSAGLRVLLVYLKQMQSINGKLRFVNPSEKVRDLFDLSGLTHVLTTALGDHPSGDSIPGIPLPDHTGLYTVLPVITGDRNVAAGSTETEETAGLYCYQGVQKTGEKHFPVVRYPGTRMGFGLGAFDDTEVDSGHHFGEYLSAGGVTICVPTDGRNHPDYMIEDGVFVPSISVYSGVAVDARFTAQLNFEVTEHHRGVPLSSLALLTLRQAATPFAAALIIAETASLIGGQRISSPLSSVDMHDVREIRKHFSFTTDPTYRHNTAIICALFSTAASPLLRPITPEAVVHGHAHAAVLSHKPLPDGAIDPWTMIRTLFDYGSIHGVLHLMYDDRNPLRNMESEFLRGSMWVVPLPMTSDGGSDPC